MTIKVNGEFLGVSGAPTVQNDTDCESAALALVSAAVGVGTNVNLQGNPTETQCVETWLHI
jgi:hypothetical protein